MKKNFSFHWILPWRIAILWASYGQLSYNHRVPPENILRITRWEDGGDLGLWWYSWISELIHPGTSLSLDCLLRDLINALRVEDIWAEFSVTCSQRHSTETDPDLNFYLQLHTHAYRRARTRMYTIVLVWGPVPPILTELLYSPKPPGASY